MAKSVWCDHCQEWFERDHYDAETGDHLIGDGFGPTGVTLDKRDRFETALHAIMRATDPGDLRSREAQEAWEAVTPARRIAREVLGLEIGGHATPPGAERRGVRIDW